MLEDERKAGTCYALTVVQAFTQITWLDATNQTENRQYVHYVDKESAYHPTAAVYLHLN